jgi:hypothetical protein
VEGPREFVPVPCRIREFSRDKWSNTGSIFNDPITQLPNYPFAKSRRPRCAGCLVCLAPLVEERPFMAAKGSIAETRALALVGGRSIVGSHINS